MLFSTSNQLSLLLLLNVPSFLLGAPPLSQLRGSTNGRAGDSGTIQSEESSVEIVNPCQSSSTEQCAHLHVFLQVTNVNQRWTQVGGNGQVYPPIAWGTPEASAWEPLGAKIASEAIIPPGQNIVLQIPELSPPQFVMMAIKMNEFDKSTPLEATMASNFVNGVPKDVVAGQQAVLIEAGKDVVADASAVDGINYKIKYELTSDGEIKTTEITTNPCEGLDDKYKSGTVGCRNPAKVDCSGEASCDCEPGTQNCTFNECSQTLFNIPEDLKKYIGTYDGGDANGKPVKSFINDPANLKVGSALAKFCTAVNGVGDFTTYCYDYNDVSSSPWLSSPYKIKVTYSEL